MRIKNVLKKILGVVLLGLFLAPVIFYNLVLVGFWGDLPDLLDIQAKENMSGSVVLSSDNRELGRFYVQDRSPVRLKEVSPHVIEALIATEDERFYQHDGTDYRSLLRVLFKSILLNDRSSGGGSTLTQQLAKNMFPRVSAGILFYPVNKVREIEIASRLEEIYTKEEILEKYLNTVSFGEDVFGIESASKRFFNKSAGKLNLVEAATLVGMLKATTSYNPVRHPDEALARRNVVLGQLARVGHLSTDSVDYYQQFKLETDYIEPKRGEADYFMARVRVKADSIIEAYNRQNDADLNIDTDGLIINTTVNYGIQRIARKSLESHLARLQKDFDAHWSGDRLWKANPELLNREIEFVRHGRTDEQLEESKHIVIYQPDGAVEKDLSSIDSLKYYLGLLHSGMVSMNPNSGAVLSWVGGRDFQYFPYDHVRTSAKRQVGSVFKPLVYATALELDLDPCEYYAAEQVAYEVEEGEWKPSNSGNEYEGKYTMEAALEGSINTIAVKIMDEIGVDNTIEMAYRLGIRSELPPVPSLALGTASISPLEMATAYSSITNGGNTVEPYIIESIITQDGTVIYGHKQHKASRVMDSETSSTMVYMLQNVVNDGTGRALRSTYGLNNDIGGKTGTTQGNADGWFVATTPNMVTAIWTGGTYPAISFRDTRMGQGATMALPIYGKLMQEMNKSSAFDEYTKAKYPSLSEKAQASLDCDPFKENFELFKWLFGKKKSSDQQVDSNQENKEEKGLFKRIGSLFKKKNKN